MPQLGFLLLFIGAAVGHFGLKAVIVDGTAQVFLSSIHEVRSKSDDMFPAIRRLIVA
jgi:hypothetical protein